MTTVLLEQRHGTLRSTGKRRPEFVTLYRAPPLLRGVSRARVVLLHQGLLAWDAPVAASRLVGQSLQALLHKPLRPLVDKAAADPHRGGDVDNGHPISEE